ncbi:esterase FrsA [Vibrio sp. S9_S30]|uniref:esterase FrsA n=1 Tax=Vibrio sp. S9_S30 TaxID=2720226 RepID=UPI0016819154|nr:esterase FrsA [Vibrio sp. S9_S30]MBD1555920.1 esterase FrsA [Vibrio sp. S9_S30]
MPEEQISKNLSEELFQNHRQAKETSALVRYMPSNESYLDEQREKQGGSWYRTIRRMQWIWQGIEPLEIEEVLARIASSTHSRTHDEWLDTVMGYHSGNWTYEWIHQGMLNQRKAEKLKGDEASDAYFRASLCFSIAGYPHIKGDNLSIQAQILVHKAYDLAMEHSSFVTKNVEVPFGKKKIKAHLHLPHTERQLPVVIVSGGLDSLQSDMWRLFRDYFAPNEIAMLTLDMPSIGHSSHWDLTEDSSCLHKAILDELPRLPWVDHFKVGLLGFRFGGNVAIRLSFLEQDRIKACVALGAPVHDVLTSTEKLLKMPKMYLDMLSSRLGKEVVDVHSLAAQMRAWSLKTQGFLTNRRTQVPILALGLEGDPISPYSDNKLVSIFSHGGKAKKVSSKSISKGYEESLLLALQWLKDELK